ncbi:MAG: putative MFS family arabinose efflux permease [Paracoccaceae bacterium]
MGETLVWAGLFYTFAALLLHWEADLSWAKTDLMLGFTLAILTSAIFAPVFGRLIDAGYGKWVLTGGAVTGAGLLVLLAHAQSRVEFITLWMMIGAAQAACLYEPCFAFITRVVAGQARAAITRITLVAGFASTLAFPLAATLAQDYGWRGALLVFAGIVGFAAAPLLFFGATLLENSVPEPAVSASHSVNKAAVRRAIHRVEFWLIAGAFAFISLIHSMVISHILPMFVDRGATAPEAVQAAMLIGPAQVAGRLLMMRLEKQVSTSGVALWAISGGCVAASVLFLAGFQPALVFPFAILQGASFGVVSILRQVLVAEVLGRVAFGAISSRVAIPFLVAAATAPYIAAVLWNIGGYDLVIITALCFALAGLVSVMMLRRITTRKS